MPRRRRSFRSKDKRPSKRKGVPWAAIKKHNRKRKTSSIEKIVQDWLKEDGIPFKREKTIGRCHVDIFLEPNICIEIQGCHWHNCPQCVKNPTDAQRIATKKDIRRFRFFRSKGYVVVDIWEHAILESPETVRRLLRGLANVDE